MGKKKIKGRIEHVVTEPFSPKDIDSIKELIFTIIGKVHDEDKLVGTEKVKIRMSITESKGIKEFLKHFQKIKGEFTVERFPHSNLLGKKAEFIVFD